MSIDEISGAIPLPLAPTSDPSTMLMSNSLMGFDPIHGNDLGLYDAPSTALNGATFTSSAKKRRLSRPRPGRMLSKSVSSPQMRAAALLESEADKKRNKLGYQRISIACAHCRRRKIRCLVADGDTRNRCQNCIRLKKECVFYPVDQQAALDSRAKSTSKSASGSTNSSGVSSSPDDISSRRRLDSEAGGLRTLPSNVSSAFQGIPLQDSLLVGDSRYPPRSDSHHYWTPSIECSPHAPETAVMGPPIPAQQPFWTYDQHVSGVSYPTYTSEPIDCTPPPSQHSRQAFAIDQPRTTPQLWQSPHAQSIARSMSYSQVDARDSPGLRQSPFATDYRHFGSEQNLPSMTYPPLTMGMSSAAAMVTPTSTAAGYSTPIVHRNDSLTGQASPYSASPHIGDATLMSSMLHQPMPASGDWPHETSAFGFLPGHGHMPHASEGYHFSMRPQEPI